MSATPDDSASNESPTPTMGHHPEAEVPDRLFTDATAERRWRDRFTAPRVSLPEWARDAAERGVYVSNVSGTHQLHTWQRARTAREQEQHTQATHRDAGTTDGALDPAGEWLWWFDDSEGDEFGQWVRQPFGQRAEEAAPAPALPGVPSGYSAGLQLGSACAAVGVASDAENVLYTRHGDGDAAEFYRSEHSAGISALSRDETLLAISHSEHGDARHPAVRVLRLDPAHPGGVAAEPVGELWDGPGKGNAALAFSPVAGDQRLLVLHERRGIEELLIWDLATGEQTELHIDLPGEVEADWYHDASALLVVHTHRARTTLHRYRPDTGELVALPTPEGTVRAAQARPDGSVEYTWSSAAHPSSVRVLDAAGDDMVLLRPGGQQAPGSEPVRDVLVPSAVGEVHALLARPAGAPEEGPVPTVFSLHGGPHAADADSFAADRAAWLDAGFAVVHVNYRGSTGYGSQWRDAIEGQPGLTELEDVAAVQDYLIAADLCDPTTSVVEGWSWGGYLALLALGTQPWRWAAGVSGVPVADYVAAYADEMEPLKDFDRALFGGSPEQLPDSYRLRSPITYSDHVRAPVLILAAENDPRCPIRQIENYLDGLAARNAEYAVYRFDSGHGSLVIADTLAQFATAIAFAREAVSR